MPDPLLLVIEEGPGGAQRRPYRCEGSVARVGRSTDSELSLADAGISWQHGRFAHRDDGWYYEDLGSSNGSLLNDRRLEQRQPERLQAGDRLILGNVRLTALAPDPVAASVVPMAPAQKPLAVGASFLPSPHRLPQAAGALPALRLPDASAEAAGTAAAPPANRQPSARTIGAGTVRVGRAFDNDIVLADPHVSSYHLTAWPKAGGLAIKDLGSSNGTFVDGLRVTEAVIPLTASVQLGPDTLLRAVEILARLAGAPSGARQPGEPLAVGQRIGRVVGKGKVILRDIDLCVRRGQFVAVVGGSGTGKSTLIKILNGYNTPSSGTLTTARNDQGDEEIGYVPQDDIIHRELPLRDAIILSAVLRYPPGTPRERVAARADEVLADLGLTERATTVVSQLSGGQRKRAGVAVELMTRPRLLVLDEATSGLDPATDRKLMELLRKLADSGVGIVLVTHATANIDLCDTVAFLASGGYQVFWGSPDEAKRYFGIGERFDDIYLKLEAEGTPEQWRQRFERSDAYQTLQKDLNAGSRSLELAARTPVQPRPAESTLLLWQFTGLMLRYFRTLMADRRNLILLLAQVPILTLIAKLLLYPNPSVLIDPHTIDSGLQLLFILSLVMIWAGSFNSAREICKEGVIWERERHIGVRPIAYVGSKLAVLGVLCSVQTLSMTVIVALGWHLPVGANVLPGIAAAGLLAALSGVALGLSVSALVSTPDQAMAVLPMLVIPQLMLGGLLVTIKQMGAAGNMVTTVVSARWAFGALGNVTNRLSLLNYCDANPSALCGVRTQFNPNWIVSLALLLTLTAALSVAAVGLVGRGARPARAA